MICIAINTTFVWMAVTVHKVLSDRDLDAIYEIRQEVFVVEQEVPHELEYDEFEETSHHFIAKLEGDAVGTARWRKTPNGIKLERFAVIKDKRNHGIGGELVRAVLEDVPSGFTIYLHSQLPATSLYERYGFQREGDTFEEAGIMHYKMVLSK